MSPTPEELELGQKAYRRLKNYEKNDGQSFRPQLKVIGVITMSLIVYFFLSNPQEQQRLHDKLSILVPLMPIFVVIMFLQYRTEKESHFNRKLLLQLLKEKYGDSLPWIADEKQLASASALEAAIAKDSTASHA